MHNIVAQQSEFAKGEYGEALKNGFLSTDRAILEDKSFGRDPSGCTATTAIVAGNKVIVANAGDSRTVLGVRGIAKPLSFDHKPDNEGEKSRICTAGGYVEVGRVNGNLALSRAIGDFDFKMTPSLPPEEQIVTAYPDVMEHEVTPDDEFLVLACDGIWDCMHSQAVIEFVRRGIVAKQSLSDICENLMDNCLAPSSNISGIGCDNMTVLIVGLLNGKTKEEWYDMIARRVEEGDGPVAPESSAEMKGNPFTNGENEQAQANNAGGGGGGGGGLFNNSMGATISLQQILGHSASVLNNSNGGGSYVIETDDARSLLNSVGISSSDVEVTEEPVESSERLVEEHESSGADEDNETTTTTEDEPKKEQQAS